jgi:hypothetical protein
MATIHNKEAFAIKLNIKLYIEILNKLFMNSTSRRRFISQSTLAAASFFIVPRYVLGKGYTAPSDLFGLGFIGTGKQARG